LIELGWLVLKVLGCFVGVITSLLVVWIGVIALYTFHRVRQLTRPS
jgi:hypothetical protein